MKNFLKAVGFAVIFWAFYWLVSVVVGWGSGLLSKALNLDTFIGSLIFVVIASGFIWGVMFTGTMGLCVYLLKSKAGSIFGLVYVSILVGKDLLFMFGSGWVLVILSLVEVAAAVLPCVGNVVAVFNEKMKE